MKDQKAKDLSKYEKLDAKYTQLEKGIEEMDKFEKIKG